LDIYDILNKYVDLIGNKTYSKYINDLSRKITNGLNEGYSTGDREPKLVDIIDRMVNSIGQLSNRGHSPYCKLTTDSFFIHGSRSQVEFDYYGEETQRELADLMFIISITGNGKKYFEKVSLVQFKNYKKQKRTVKWDLSGDSSQEQLYLLSKFPTFKPRSESLFPPVEYNLTDSSRTLGTYGFLYEPGDFFLVSAKGLDEYMCSRKSIKGSDMIKLYKYLDNKTWFLGSAEFLNFYRLYRFWEEVEFNDVRFLHSWLNTKDIGNCLYANSTHDFIDKYLRFCIGEPTIVSIGRENYPVKKFLFQFINNLRYLPEQRKPDNLNQFIDSYLNYEEDEIREDLQDYPREDIEDGGIGIINTTIDLSEG